MKKSILYILLFVSLFSNVNHAFAQSGCIGTAGTIDWYIYNRNYGSTLDYLYHQHGYPNSPDEIKQLGAIATTVNYKNSYGSLLRGYIQAPESGNYTFNITGDDYCKFFLSTTNNPANLVERCEVLGYTGTEDYSTYPEQTSSLVNLAAGQYYYFEVHHAESSGGDHVRVQWRKPSAPSADWEVIHGAYLYSYTCSTICPSAGTACDDGNANTIDDQEDGNCNCVGTPNNAPTCVGTRDSLLALYYDNITGYGLSNLLADASYPDSPTRGAYFDEFNETPDWGNPTPSEFGTRIQVMLRAPETGNYTFNVTGANQMSLRLSTDTNPANATEIATTWYAGFNDHWSDPNSTSSPVLLQAGNFYYMEYVRQVGPNSTPFFNVSWKIPMASDTTYKYLDPTFLYQYNCETACMPQGLACDDGNPNTFNDQFDTNCACAGTPCSDPACTNALDYTPIDNCATTDEHSNYQNDSWLSCQASSSPNIIRGTSHWIQYDFGQSYLIEDVQVWNYNVSGQTQQGFKDVIIDYSVDGFNWTTLGVFTWSEAPGVNSYTGFGMAQFNGISARYVLVTAQNNFENSNCMGLSEIRFTVTDCPTVGMACNDGDPTTSNDRYDSYCNCAGVAIVENNCADPDLIINDVPVISDNYDAINTIYSTGLVPNGAVVSYIAGDCITMDAGFEVKLGADFLADIIPCSPADIPDDPSLRMNMEQDWIDILPHENKSLQTIHYNIVEEGDMELALYSMNGDLVTTLQKGAAQKGIFETQISKETLQDGIYLLTLKTAKSQTSERIVIVKN